MPSPHEYGRSPRPADDADPAGRRPAAPGESRPYRSEDGYSYDPASYGGSVYRPTSGTGTHDVPTPPGGEPSGRAPGPHASGPPQGPPGRSPYGAPAGPGGPPPSSRGPGPGGAGGTAGGSVGPGSVGPGSVGPGPVGTGTGGHAGPPETSVPGPRPASPPDPRRGRPVQGGAADPDRDGNGGVRPAGPDGDHRTRSSPAPAPDRAAPQDRRRGLGGPGARGVVGGAGDLDADRPDQDDRFGADDRPDEDDRFDEDGAGDADADPDDDRRGAGVAPSAAGRRGRSRTGGRSPKGKRKGSFWRELPLLLVVAVVLTFVIQTFVARIYVIPSQSMEQTLIGCTGCTNDRVAVDKVTYRFADPSPGDVVVFAGPPAWRENDEGDAEQPSSNVLVRGFEDLGSLVGLGSSGEKDFVKRVIAVGGQTVACCDAQHRVTVDGRALDESYLYVQPGTPATQEAFAPVQVPAGQLWVMGDNRNNSADSRYHGPIGVSDVIGKARLVVLPVSRWTTVPGIDPQAAPAALGPLDATGPALGGAAILVALPLAGRLDGRGATGRSRRVGRRRGPRA